ncbi:hypothetical protein [Treponema bryantii]|nr:hypothetical protein [Treponema bryantii]
MVDKIAVSLGIPSSALFEDKFGKSLEEELISRIEKDIKDVCKLV